MSTPNLSYSNLDARYTKPTDVDTKIAAQATTDAGQYAPIEITTLNDNFSRSDGIIGTDPNSGYTWSATGTTPPLISSGKLASTGSGTAYATIPLSRAPVSMSGTVSFATGSGTDASPNNLVLASSSIASQSPWNLIHVQYNQTGWQAQKAINNVFSTVGSGTWTTPMAKNGTVYSVSWRLNGSTLTITGPNNETAQMTDSDFVWLNGRYCFWSIEPQDTNAPLGYWRSATATELRPTKPSSIATPADLWIPDSGAAQNMPSYLGSISTITPLTSGTIYCAGLTLPAGVPINWVEFFSDSTAGASLTHQWAVVMDRAGRVVAVSSDITSTGWAASSRQRFTLTSQFTTAGPMAVYVGLLVTGTTMPNLAGLTAGRLGPQTYGPNYSGASNSGQTTPPTVGTLLNKPPASNLGIPYVVVG